MAGTTKLIFRNLPRGCARNLSAEGLAKDIIWVVKRVLCHIGAGFFHNSQEGVKSVNFYGFQLQAVSGVYCFNVPVLIPPKCWV